GRMSSEATTSVRFLTSVESLLLDHVTFFVELPESGKTWTINETRAFSSLRVNGESVSPSDPEAFGTPDARYFVAHALTDIPVSVLGQSFTVTPSWTTLDGTVVTGTSSTFAITTELLKDSLFTNETTVNGVALKSETAHWDFLRVKQNIMRAASGLGSTLQPFYFTSTGTNVLFQAHVTVTGNTQGDPMAGLWFHDGTDRAFIGIRGGGLYCGRQSETWDQWYDEGEDWPMQILSPAWNGPAEADLTILLKNGQITVTVNDTYEVSLALRELMPDLASGAKLAFGLVAYTYSDRNYDMTFSNVRFTTDIAEINAYLGIEEDYIPYGTGLRDDLQYRSDLYGLNESNDVEGADPGAFYVSEAEDPVYGGYYYMYLTGSTRDDYGIDDLGVNCYAFRCYRSKDLYQWELAGALQQGYSMIVDWGDWAMNAFWAPEVIRNPQDGKYYMYFSAGSRPDWGVEGMSSNGVWSDKLYLGVAVAPTPAGPFDMLYDTDPATGKRMPTINFKTGCNLSYDWPAIDVSPFFDDDGTLYLYFNKHAGSHYGSLYGVWGMKMNSMTSPDYSTVSFLAKPDYVTVQPGTYTMESFSGSIAGNRYEFSEGSINEAPFMTKHNGKYYLTYASNGYSSKRYSVHQAIGDSPLGDFVKLTSAEGNPVLDGSQHGGSTYNYVNGTAHHAIVTNGDEMWIVYHKHASTLNVDAGPDRSVSADRVQFVTNENGTDVLTASGPTLGLVWLPEAVSGYENLAKTASVSLSSGNGTAYLTDELLPFYTAARDRVMTSSGTVAVTFTWSEPVSASSVMIYNAYEKNRAFTEVSEIRMTLAGAAERYAVIEHLAFPARYLVNGTGAYVPCAPAVAEFESLLITELTVMINADGPVDLSEIVVLGKKNQSIASLTEFESFCQVANDSDVTIDGILNETAWRGKKYLKNGFGTGSGVMKTTGFAGTAGIYIASEVTDPNIVNDGQHTMTMNSAFEYYIAAYNAGTTGTKKFWQTYHFIVDMRGDCHAELPTSFRRAVTTDGEKATVEIFIPWELLNVDVSRGIPTSFRLYPIYRAVLPGDSEVTAMDPPDVEKEDVGQYFLFDRIGYHEKDPFASSVVVNQKTVASYQTNWDLSDASEGVVRGSYAMGSSFKPLYFSETGNTMLFHTTVSYTTSFVSGQTYQSDPLGGIYVTDGTTAQPIGVRQHGVVYK
ncbi:MAG: family 43 glycosylhydrolase, partial [Lachnospiraceae bacterium]|nr:family 43 glycosylhydrolase [Lachnospiraceae bacterium]